MPSSYETSEPGAAPPVPRRTASGAPALSLLFLTVFLDLVGFGIVIPLLPLYAERFGATPLAVTALVAVYSLLQFLVAPLWGRLSDRIGRRPVILVGLFGSAASYLLFALAGSLAILFVARALAGAMGATIGVAQAYIADVTTPERRARGMGMIGAAFGLGFIFGPVIGGLLAHLGAAAPFFGATVLALLNGVLAIRWLPESLPRGRRGIAVSGSLVDRLHLLRIVGGRRVVGSLCGAFFLLTFAFAALEATLSLWADRRWELSPSQVAYLFAYLGVLVTLVQGGLVGPLARHVGERRMAVGGSISMALGLLALPLAPTPPMVAAALALLALGQGTAFPALSSLISREAPPGEQGRLLGVSQSLSALGRVVGPLWGGLAFARVGIGAPYLSGAVVVALAGALLATTFVTLAGRP